MTAEERNRRAKWGHDLPRDWFPDFNMTHRDEEIQPPKIVKPGEADQLAEMLSSILKKRRPFGPPPPPPPPPF